MGNAEMKKYLLRIHNNTEEDTISVISMTDIEFSYMVEMVINFNSFSFTDGMITSYLTYFEKPFDTQKEAIQYYKDNEKDIEWRAFTMPEDKE